MITDEKIINRFLVKVDYNANEKGCWLWTASLDRHGYGVFWYNGARAHRVAWEIFREEPLEDGLVLDHLCHCRNCVNPAHLRQVTQTVNSNNPSPEAKAYRYAAGKKMGSRSKVGERNSKVVLTEEQVLKILTLGKTKSCAVIAKEFNCVRGTIYNILKGITWKHIERLE